MYAITVGKALATISVGWAALFSVAHTDIDIPVTETTTETTTSYLDNNLYPATGIITEINTDTDTYTWTDFGGNLWEENGVEDFSEGDRIAVIMNNNGTPAIYDDYTTSIRYCGWEY